MRRRIPFWPVLFVLGVTAVGCSESSAPSRTKVKDPPQVAGAPGAPLTGTLSCSGRGCHADFERPHEKDQLPFRSSYTRWLHHDPHSRAYEALLSPLGLEMGKKLGIADVAKEPRCLVCHCTPLAARDEPWAREERVFGVGCEACHGPARDWLTPHRTAGWQKDPEEFARHGMNWLQSQSVRAGVCAGCHVGPADPQNGLPARDVTHDFIAAGHPRLMFEYGTFLANLPKHWTEKDTRPDFEARAFLVGQAVSVQSWLRLLNDRAAHAPDQAWPELAEFNCFACHHTLEGRSWRQKRGYGSGKPGALRMADWYPALTSVAIAAARPEAPPFTFEALRKTMARRAPSRNDVRLEAAEALKSLKTLATALENRTYDRKALANLRDKLIAKYDGEKLPDWDEIEQIALGLKALTAADDPLRKEAKEKTTPPDKEFAATVDLLLQKLAFPPGYNSPVGFRRQDSFEEELKALFDRLKGVKKKSK